MSRLAAPLKVAALTLAALTLAALTLVVLAGCAAHPLPSPAPSKETTMNATQAHDELDALMTDAQLAVGGTWTHIDGGAEICTTKSGANGATFPFGRLGPGVPADQQAAVLTAVAAKWKSAGFDADIHSLGTENGLDVQEVRYPASGNGTDGIYLSLTMTVMGTALDAQSRCVPGDADKINDQRAG